MTLLFILGVGIWMIGDGISGPAGPVLKIVGGVAVLLSPFVHL